MVTKFGGQILVAKFGFVPDCLTWTSYRSCTCIVSQYIGQKSHNAQFWNIDTHVCKIMLQIGTLWDIWLVYCEIFATGFLVDAPVETVTQVTTASLSASLAPTEAALPLWRLYPGACWDDLVWHLANCSEFEWACHCDSLCKDKLSQAKDATPLYCDSSWNDLLYKDISKGGNKVS